MRGFCRLILAVPVLINTAVCVVAKSLQQCLTILDADLQSLVFYTVIKMFLLFFIVNCALRGLNLFLNKYIGKKKT